MNGSHDVFCSFSCYISSCIVAIGGLFGNSGFLKESVGNVICIVCFTGQGGLFKKLNNITEFPSISLGILF